METPELLSGGRGRRLFVDDSGAAAAAAANSNTKTEGHGVMKGCAQVSGEQLQHADDAVDQASNTSKQTTTCPKESDHADEELIPSNTAEQAADSCVGGGGGIEAIVASMKAHRNQAKLQEDACRALLKSMATGEEHGGGRDGEKFVSAVRQAGGMESIVAAMQAHPSQTTLQQVACQALGSLSLTLNDTHEIAKAQADAIAAIVEAMNRTQQQQQQQQYPANNNSDHAMLLQEHACSALWNLSLNDDNRKAMTRAGGIPTLLAAMKAHPDRVMLQECACGSLWSLSFCKDNKASIQRLGGIEIISAAIKTHPGQMALQEYAQGALLNLEI